MSEENERRERIINNMCMTLRHDYGMDKLEGSDFDSEISSGMTKYDRAVLHMEMSAIFDHHIAPILSELRDFQAGAKAEADAGDEARAEVRRLTQIIIHSEAGRIGANLKRVMDQKQIDELVALGIQQDKDEIARLMAENERWRRNYEHLIEQHMPRTGEGCEEGWSRVIEARELQEVVERLTAENDDLKKRAQSAFEAGRAASRRPIAIIQRSGNSWNVFEQRYNDDRTERNDRFIRGGFVTSVDATSWARSNGYEVEV